MPFTLIKPFQLTEEIKKSRFIVNAAPIISAEEAAEWIQHISDPAATHNCWAWKLGQQYRFNDDGEPTSTAGKPILAAIEGQSCDQVAVVVTRYFGGIKLGTGGLIRAYGGSASHCLQQAEKIELIARKTGKLACLYSEWAILENKLHELDVIIENQTFTETGTELQIAITHDKISLLDQFISNLTRGKEKLFINQ